jgi:hypothetical protein
METNIPRAISSDSARSTWRPAKLFASFGSEPRHRFQHAPPLGSLIGWMPSQTTALQFLRRRVSQLPEDGVHQDATNTTSVCRNSRAFMVM